MEDNKMEKELAKQESTTKVILEKQEKVPIFIPEDPLNPNDVVPVGINGVIYSIPRGKQFMVPKSIYEVWKSSYDETLKANKRIRVSENKDLQIIG